MRFFRFRVSRGNASQKYCPRGKSQPEQAALQPHMPQQPGQWRGYPQAQTVETIEQAADDRVSGQPSQSHHQVPWPIFAPEKVRDPPYRKDADDQRNGRNGDQHELLMWISRRDIVVLSLPAFKLDAL